MEVTHLSDYDTHAVMGGGKTKGFGILNTAEFITVLSSTLYSDAFLAVIREVVCNAWDAHKMVGKQNVPIDIVLNQTELVIRDYGPGIDPKKMVDIYCTYGNSTKKDQENQTGGFGLGSKSPFAYTNYFTVTVNYAGIKTIWAVSRGSADTGGMPDIRDMFSGPTTDEGVEVNIPLNDPQDADKFRKVINDVVRWGEINACLNGNLIPTIPMSQTKNGVLFSSEIPPTVNGRLYVRYGNVIYPIPIHREYEALYEGANKLLERTAKQYHRYGSYEVSSGEGLKAFFEAEPNTISVTPSRESIHTSDRTIATVTKMLQSFIDECGNLGSAEYAFSHEKKLMDMIIKKMGSRAILTEDNLIAYYYSNISVDKDEDKYRRMMGNFMSVEEVVIAMAARGFIFNDDTVLHKARKQRIEYIIQNDKKDVDLFLKLTKLLKKFPTLWSGSKIPTKYLNRVNYNPISIDYIGILKKAAKAGLDPRRFYMWKRSGYAGRHAYAGDLLVKMGIKLSNLLELSTRKVMIVSSKSQITNHNHKHTKDIPNWDKLSDERVIVYHVPTSLKKSRGKFLPKSKDTGSWASYEETLEFFKKNNYEIIDIVGFYRDQYPPKPKAVTKTIKIAKTTTAFKRKKGTYPSIKYLIDPATGEIDLERAKHSYNKDMSLLDNYELVFKGDNLTARSYNPRFFPWGDVYSRFVIKEYGDKAVFVKSEPEYSRLKLDGIKDGNDYLLRDICEKLLNDSEFRKARELNGLWRHMWVDEETYKVLKTKTLVGKILPDVPVMPDISEDRYDLFINWQYKQHWMSFEQRQLWEKTRETILSWSKERVLTDLEKFFTDEKKDKFFDIEGAMIIRRFKVDEFKSPEQKAFNESLLIQVLS